MTCSMQRRRRAGLRSFPTRLPSRSASPASGPRPPSRRRSVLLLQILQPLHLVALQPAELLAPAIIGERRHPNRPNRLRNRRPWDTKTSTCRSFATISSGLCFLLRHRAILQRLKSLLQGGPLFRGRPMGERPRRHLRHGLLNLFKSSAKQAARSACGARVVPGRWPFGRHGKSQPERRIRDLRKCR